MATLWDIVINNSTLEVQEGTNFWDHINNPKTGSGTVIIGGIRTANLSQKFTANAQQALSANNQQARLTADKPVSLSASIQQKFEAEICQ